jgi:hypothetical protein
MKRTLFDDAVPEPTPRDAGLPPIHGSVKQVSWAERVRSEKLAGMHRLLQQQRRLVQVHREAGRTLKAAQAQVYLGKILLRMERVEQQANAGWWIDRKDQTALEILNEVPVRSETMGAPTWETRPADEQE